jgi:hypothetical protein
MSSYFTCLKLNQFELIDDLYSAKTSFDGFLRLKFFHLISINCKAENRSDFFIKPEFLMTKQTEMKTQSLVIKNSL